MAKPLSSTYALRVGRENQRMLATECPAGAARIIERDGRISPTKTILCAGRLRLGGNVKAENVKGD